MEFEYDKAVEALAERYDLVKTCGRRGFDMEDEARNEGRFGVSVVARAAGKSYGEVLADVRRASGEL